MAHIGLQHAVSEKTNMPILTKRTDGRTDGQTQIHISLVGGENSTEWVEISYNPFCNIDIVRTANEISLV